MPATIMKQSSVQQLPQGLHHQRITIKRYLALPSKLARTTVSEQLGSSPDDVATTQPPDELSTLDSTPVVGRQPEEASQVGSQHEELPMNGPLFIDRHVLTENEVLPNLETNSNKLWSSRFSRSLKSSIAYRFRVYCSLNYFGDGCTVFCRARDDHFGHYNCSSTGHKVCHEGWHGSDCDKPRCRQGCAGHCDRPDTCLCRPGWTGSRCDECLTYPGCGNGFCLSAWQCICHRNWGGQLCNQDLNYCGTHEPCKNNGTCHNVAPARYKCNCPEGFTGVDCDISLKSVIALTNESSNKHQQQQQQQQGCMLNPCLNGGVCLEFRSLEQAPNNRLGNQSDSVEVDSNPSSAFANNLYRCQCNMGWYGDFCQWPDASYLPLNEPLNDTQEILMTADIKPSISEEFSPASAGIYASSDEPPLTAFTEFPTHIIKFATQPITSSSLLELRHLISWVLIASVIGVFLATLILAWCCLFAVERSKFSLIQMNFVRNMDDTSDTTATQQPSHPVNVSGTIRRFHEKIRDSLRLRNNCRIKPETKLSIENALTPPKPPPSYEESNCDATRTIEIEYPIKSKPGDSFPKGGCNIERYLNQANSGDDDENSSSLDVVDYTLQEKFRQDIVSEENLVKREESNLLYQQRELHHLQQSPVTLLNSNTDTIVGHAQLNCPRHGHLYRQQQQQQQRNTLRSSDTSPPTC